MNNSQGSISSQGVPAPAVMGGDREAWAQQLSLCNFVNSYYQLRDIHLCADARRVLIVGPGQGLDTGILRWRGFDVTTFDIDSTFSPDYVGSVHDLSMFANQEFDVVVASHVLEHLPVPYLDTALREIARVGKHALVYLPVAGRHFQFRWKSDVREIDLSLVFDVFNYFRRPDGVTRRYCAGQHYWETGMRGFRVSNLLARFGECFDVITHYRNRDWNPSYNFVLKAKRLR